MTKKRDLKELSTDDALKYINVVKTAFHDKKEKFDRFLDLMKEFKDKRIDMDSLVTKVKELFKGHNELIPGFNIFMPHGQEIKLPSEDEGSNHLEKRIFVGSEEEATSFVNKIKIRFQGDDGVVYKYFLDTMNKCSQGKRSFSETYLEGAALLEGHADLLHELSLFFPGAQTMSTD